MSTICDACKKVLDHDDGCARVMITDPTPDFHSLSPDEIAGLSHRRTLPQVDLCATCLTKMIEVMELPPDTFTPRPARAATASTGALSAEDLAQLGIDP